MENQRLHTDLRNKLHDLESPFNDRVSFEAVMEKRKRKKRRAIFWIPTFAVVAGLFVVGGLGMLWVSTDQSPEKAPQMAFSKSVYKPKFAQKGTIDKSQTLTLGAASGSPEIGTSESAVSLARKRALSSRRVVTVSKIETASPGFEIPEIASPEMPKSIESGITSSVSRFMAKAESPVSLGVPTAESPLVNETNVPEAAHQDMLCDPQGLKLVDIGVSDPEKTYLEIPEGEYERSWDPELLKSKWYAEMSATTGSKVVINFNEDDRLSVLGNMYHANYHGLILKDVGSGFMVGGGFSYGEWIGNGEWRTREFEERMEIDTYDVVVMIPPVQSVRVYDTTYNQVRVEEMGKINYRINKIAIPIALRYNFMLGKWHGEWVLK
jgi:cytoskeletal protein RodZ